ncbi:PREDICTED: pentatricopeptide [Prunus dulcis]|uniref:PREDICTED: pentatricopeptide n=1 Tax=Prunus dulcis TaxID=3755 RepID=A0A5E4E4I2_PRUDU|nr:PREDICTED: pentatricopeptide [Prunus dulcis]
MANEDLVSWNAILSGYSQEGNHGLEAIFVFIEMVGEGMGLDHVPFTSAVSACGHEMNLELGLTIKSGYGSHVSVCNVLISTYSKCEVTEDAKLVLQCMNDRNTGFLSMHNVCNSLITMYAKFDSIHDSIKVFEELNCREIISWNALISGYARNGLCQDALKTFLEATMESKPNNYTFGSVLSAIGDAQDTSLNYGQ